ncbi:MAG: hypothetical protein SCM11_00650 [Bacillota bacterium]|nr:hypothetical protein [Bacillota bacterium]
MHSLGSRLDRKRNLLVKMLDRIFLNPAAKIKNVPAPAEAKQSNSGVAQFKRLRDERLAREQSNQMEDLLRRGRPE